MNSVLLINIVYMNSPPYPLSAPQRGGNRGWVRESPDEIWYN